MKNKIKQRILAFLMAVLMVVSTVFANDLSLVTANATDADPADPEIENVEFNFSITGFTEINDVPGAFGIKIRKDGQVYDTIEVDSDNKGSIVLTKEENVTYSYVLESGNYEIANIGGNLNFDNPSVAILISNYSSKYIVSDISGTNNITYGDSARYTISVDNSVWADKLGLTWSVTDGTDVIEINGSGSGKSCDVKTLKSGSATLQVTGDSGNINKSISINVSKKTVSGLSISFEPTSANVNDEVKIKVSGVPAGEKVKVNVGGERYSATAELDGVATVVWTPKDGKEHTVTAELDSEKYSGSAPSAAYTATKLTQSFDLNIIEESENKDVVITYGDEETELAEITNSTGITDIPSYEVKLYEVDENDNKTSTESDIAEVTIKDNIVVLTPKAAGKLYVEVTKTGNDVYQPVVEGFVYTIAKKEVTITAVNATPKTYDGKNDNIELTATLEGILKNAEGEYEVKNTLTGVGRTESADAGEDKEVTAKVFTLPEAGYENYVLAEGDISKIEDVSSPTVTISKAELTVTIPDGERAFRASNDSVIEKVTEGIEYTGFVNGENKSVLSENATPEISITITPTQGKIGENKSVIKADLEAANEAANAPTNYIYVSETGSNEAAYSDLTITAEEIASFTQYVSVKGDNVYQITKDEQGTEKVYVYYGYNAEAKFTITDKDSIYTKIYEVEESDDTDDFIGTEIDDVLVISEEKDNLADVTKKFRLANDAGDVYSKEFDITFSADSVTPEVEFAIEDVKTTVKELASAITFGVFKNNQIEITVGVSDLASGVNDWEYMLLKVSDLDDGNYEEYEDYADLLTKYMPSPVNGVITVAGTEADFPSEYILFVRATDNVGNQIIYASNGMIFESSVIENIDIDHENNNTYYVQDDQEVTITAKDRNENDIYSGVAKIEYTISIDGEEQKYTYLTTENGKVPDLDLDSLSAYKYLEATVFDEDGNKPEVKITDGSSAVITVSATAEDFAGNPMSEDDAYSHTFVIDKLNPDLKNELSSAATVQNGKYYNKDVVLTTTVTERFLDIYNSLEYEINGDRLTLANLQNNMSDYGIINIEVDEGDSEAYRTDKSTSTVKITFSDDNVYQVNVYVKDKSGREDEDEVDEFVVDQTAPVVSYTYYSYGKGNEFEAGSDASAPKYLNADYISFKAQISVEELNFSNEEEGTVDAKVSISAKDSAGSKVSSLTSFINNHKTGVTKADSWSEPSGITRTYDIETDANANYGFGFTYTDLAGNQATAAAGYVTLDRELPTGKITVNGLVNGDSQKTWEKQFLNAITFGLYGKNSVSTTMEAGDVTAGVKTIQYYTSSSLLNKTALAQLSDSQWTPYTKAISKAANQNLIVYEKVTDKAGNVDYFSTENIVVDNVDPAPVVTITPSKPAWGKGVYSAGDKPGFDIKVTDPTNNGAYSGLEKITYTIKNGTTGATETGTLQTYTKGSHVQTYTGHVSIDPTKFYSNDVQITVTATDFSTNDATSATQTLKIDNQAPVVKFSFDTSDAKNGKYYNTNKTLTITVNERNFDTSYKPTVTSSTNGGYSFSGWSVRGETATGTITFSGDADYTVSYYCYDLAGNKSNTETLNNVTIDKTKPTVAVSYDNNDVKNTSYYKASRTATITITEHNFNASGVTVKVTASLNGSSVTVPSVSGWSSNGDRHTATIKYDADADYTFTISVTDLASNVSEAFTTQNFTVDKTDPVIEITGVENKTAYNGTVAPVINMSDINFDSSTVKISLTGVKKGAVDTTGMYTVTNTAQGSTITFANFPSGMDDIYTLTAEVFDKAGNSFTISKTFSVNRDGSTYELADYLTKLISGGYTNAVNDLVITETNVNALSNIRITVSRDGNLVELKEGEAFSIKASGSETAWRQYVYTINASAFEEEGHYVVEIYSEDEAKNKTTNTSQKQTIEFTVDKTSPVISISSLESGGRYQEDAHAFTVNVDDNMCLSKVVIEINGEVYATYEGEELSAFKGAIPVTLEGMSGYQNVKVTAYDAAGNTPTEVTVDRIAVSANRLVLFYLNKPLFYGTLIGILAVLAIIFFIIAKRRKKDDEEEQAKKKA